MHQQEYDLLQLPAGRNQLLQWAAEQTVFCWLEGASASEASYAFPRLLAVGVQRSFELGPQAQLHELDDFLTPTEIGYVVQVGYGLKDRLERLSSRHTDPIGFPALFVFEPAVLIRIVEDRRIQIQAPDPEAVWRSIQEIAPETARSAIPKIEFRARLDRDEYIQQVQAIQQHILRGDCYELNYCQEFFSTPTNIDPLQVYLQLESVAQAPFSCLYRNGDRWLIGASPERFLRRTGNRIESVPMKGTAPRDPDPEADQANATALRQSQKDRSENIMVVDLVRNDLSRIAETGSVRVESLCALRSFPQVHQLVSTVSCRIKPSIQFREILAACFPMGSMTGAPKIRVMELTDRFESSARGLYSGSIGFLESNGDFDLNVVIRSLQYQATQGYLSYHVGSGITACSNSEKEWEECLWKAGAIRRVFSGASDE
jgi:para-aminobenzoate synthetase component 1